jgi:hypothetical protein
MYLIGLGIAITAKENTEVVSHEDNSALFDLIKLFIN